MRYATSYDVGERKRGEGINEDSVAVLVFEDGHRDGYLGRWRTRSDPDVDEGRADTDAEDDAVAAAVADAEAEGTAEAETDAATTGQTDATDASPESGGGPFDELDLTDPTEEDEDPVEADTAATADAAEADVGETDSLPATRSVGVFALADGAGGHDAGDVASYIASTVVTERLAELAVKAARTDPVAFDVEVDIGPDRPDHADFQAAITDAIVAAHREILRQANEADQGAYTTIVAGVAVDGELHYGWVGDSRAYAVNPVHDRIEQLTKDHSVVEELEDAGEIDEIEGHVHPRGNEITSAIGGRPGEDPDEATVPVETHTVPLYAEDVVLVTSDGLIDAQTDAPDLYDRYVAADRSDEVGEAVLSAVVTDPEIKETVLAAPDLDAAARDLVTLANDRGGKDNVSHVLFQDDALGSTPPADRFPVRAIDPDDPIEDRQTVIVQTE
ncbi:PP2C family protein-serine/threonine phosphatase [Halobacteriales archaeon Cl-PHB]